MELLARLIAAVIAPFHAVLAPGDKAYWLHFFCSALIAALVLRRAGVRNPLRGIFAKEVWGQPSAKVDLRFYFVNAALITLVLLPLSTSQLWIAERVSIAIAGRAGQAAPVAAHGIAIGLFVAVLAALVYDLALYVPHWVQHRVPLFWQFHKVHHSAQVLTPFTAFRFHPVDDLLNIACVTGIVGALDGVLLWKFPGESMELTLQGVNIVTFLFYAGGVHLRHSHVWLPYPRTLSFVLISPAMHQIHHSTNPEHHNRNFGLIFSCWDWLFGTLYVPKEKLALQYGLGEGEEREFSTVRRLYWLPFRKAWQLAARKKPAPKLELGG